MGYFGNSNGWMGVEGWHKLDKTCGKLLKRKGYKLIHYTDDEMYGDTYCILDRSIIKGFRFENDK